MLTWRSGCVRGVRALVANGPGSDSTRGNTLVFITFFGSLFFPVIFFSNYYYITEFHNNLKYIAGFKLFSVSECLHSSTENVFHIYHLSCVIDFLWGVLSLVETQQWKIHECI